jgi:hypothetical protein
MRCCTMRNFAPLVLLGCLSVAIYAQESVTNPNQSVPQQSVRAVTRVKTPTGILTERLSPKELQRWNAIERLVFAESDGQFLHPTLRGLWEWIETSGHAIYIVFVKPTVNTTSTAGQFKLEKLDPRGERHEGIIQLNLNNIDLAYVGRETWRTAGFIPFDQLNREERYAEVLGHELAHAVDILTSVDKTARVEEMVEKTNEMLMHHRSLKPTEQLTLELRRRLNHRDAVLKVLEATAEKLEAQVWRELVNSKPLREKSGSLAAR